MYIRLRYNEVILTFCDFIDFDRNTQIFRFYFFYIQDINKFKLHVTGYNVKRHRNETKKRTLNAYYR